MPHPLQARERRWWSAALTELRGVASEPRGFIALLLLALLIAFAYILPILDPTDPNLIGDAPKNQGISWDAPLGTDHLSRDLLARNSIRTRDAPSSTGWAPSSSAG